jgi:uncharacterized protein involved in cysteine biosynthesis
MLLASPLLLIPLVGQLVFFVLGFMLFRKMLLIDVLGFRLDKSAIRSASGLMENGRYVGATFLLYLVSLVPFVNFFVAYLAVVYISHRMMQDEREAWPAAS